MRIKELVRYSSTQINSTQEIPRGLEGATRSSTATWNEKLKRRTGTAVAVLVIASLATCVLFGKNFQTTSDPHGALLVSQALIEHAQIRLDPYQSHFGDYSWQVKRKDGHFYYFFPLGTSLVATPLVAVARLLGGDMTVARHDAMTQLIIAAAAVLLSFVVMQQIARLYLDRVTSAVLSATFLFGTSFVSTGMTALWSHDFAALFALLALFTLLNAKTSGRSGSWPLTAVFVFLAYLCRPTLSLLAPIVIGIQFIYVDKKSALKLFFSLLLLTAPFIALSWREFHQLLPDYYLPSRLAGEDFWLAFYGNLASPARGLLVFSPFLLLPMLTTGYFWTKYPAYRAELSLMLWPVLHLLAISSFPHWWAGGSYGPRLMYDALPGLFVVLVIFWRVVDRRSIAARYTIVAMAFAVAINFWQGIFNPYVTVWNAAPPVDEYPELLFDWQYPQFLHNARRHERRVAQMQALTPAKPVLRTAEVDAAKAQLHRYQEHIGKQSIQAAISKHRVRAGEQYSFTSQALTFFNWRPPEVNFRRSQGYYSEIAFLPDATALSSSSIRIALDSIAPQTIRILVNDTPAGAFAISEGAVSLGVDIRGLLKPAEVNVLQFELPQARPANAINKTVVSIALKSISFTRE